MSKPYKGSRTPQNIININRFTANPDEPYEIAVSQSIILMPIWRECNGQYVDATGDFDLCMTLDGLYYHFINRLNTPATFAYRWIPPTIIQTLRNP